MRGFKMPEQQEGQNIFDWVRDCMKAVEERVQGIREETIEYHGFDEGRVDVPEVDVVDDAFRLLMAEIKAASAAREKVYGDLAEVLLRLARTTDCDKETLRIVAEEMLG